MGFVGIVAAIIIIGGIALPALYAPTSDTSASVANTTVVLAVSNTPTKYSQVLLANPDTAGTASAVIAFARNRTDNITLTDAKGGFLREIVGASPQTVTFPQTLFLNGYTSLNYTSNTTASASNITSITVTYQVLPQSTIQSWQSPVLTFWNVLLAIAIIVAAILIIIKTF